MLAAGDDNAGENAQPTDMIREFSPAETMRIKGETGKKTKFVLSPSLLVRRAFASDAIYAERRGVGCLHRRISLVSPQNRSHASCGGYRAHAYRSRTLSYHIALYRFSLKKSLKNAEGEANALPLIDSPPRY
jgi:hypothetical protein